MTNSIYIMKLFINQKFFQKQPPFAGKNVYIGGNKDG
jgi:hypothetical protein